MSLTLLKAQATKLDRPDLHAVLSLTEQNSTGLMWKDKRADLKRTSAGSAPSVAAGSSGDSTEDFTKNELNKNVFYLLFQCYV